MYKLNNKGFTLVEVIAVIVIIAILGIIAVPNVLSTINTSKQATYDILVEDITIAGKQLFEELDLVESNLFHYNSNGKTTTSIKINSNNELTVTLQTLISNGFLGGSNNTKKDPAKNNNDKIIINPKTKEDIGTCEITITKIVDSNNYNTSYQIKNNSTDNENCPTTAEYNKVLNIQEGE